MGGRVLALIDIPTEKQNREQTFTQRARDVYALMGIKPKPTSGRTSRSGGIIIRGQRGSRYKLTKKGLNVWSKVTKDRHRLGKYRRVEFKGYVRKHKRTSKKIPKKNQ